VVEFCHFRFIWDLGFGPPRADWNFRPVSRLLSAICYLLFVALSIYALATQQAIAQTQPPAVIDTTSHEMPKLEIPEITIVGKKAITLPFARKGEIYDVNVYEAPAPDSSMLLPRPEMPLPFGSWNSYKERLSLWNFSAGGYLGSFGNFGWQENVGYNPSNWQLTASGKSGFTSGYVPNSDGKTLSGDFGAATILTTDNDFMKSLRFLTALDGLHDDYGMFGITDENVRRTRNHLMLTTGLGTLQREGTTVDIHLSTHIWSITDATPHGDSSITAAEPDLGIGFATSIGHFLLGSSLNFTTASLDYSGTIQSPSLLNVAAHLGWKLTDGLSVQAGFVYAEGSGTDGSSETMLLPAGSITWEIEPGKTGSFWYAPEIELQSYDSLMEYVPYLNREVALLPERDPVRFGFSYWFNNRLLTLELSASYAQPSNAGVVVANAGRLAMAYVDADETKLEANGTVLPASAFRFRYQGMLEKANQSSGDAQLPQLPMTPALALKGVFEYDLPRAPFTLSLGGDYRSAQNVDLAGVQSLNSYFLLNAEASSTIVPHMVLAAKLNNIANVSYQWWQGYAAPGINIMLEARASF
jgi:hypothetical protein